MMKLLIFILFTPLAILSQQKTDTVIIDRTEHNVIYIEIDKGYNQRDMLNTPKGNDSYISIHLYNGRYHLYEPCDWIWHHRVTIRNDSAFFLIGEGSNFKIIKKNKKNKLIFYSLQNDEIGATLSIKTIDKKRGIVIVKFRQNDTEDFYFLAVNTKKASRYPVIINNCPNEKVDELKFDEIDFQKFFDE